ncbi:transposase [Clostridium tepidiprofundi]
MQKKFNTIKFSAKSYKMALQREKMNSAEYIELTNKRAGIEGIPAVFRRKYRVDSMPVRGFLCSKLWFGFKVAAYNFKTLLN